MTFRSAFAILDLPSLLESDMAARTGQRTDGTVTGPLVQAPVRSRLWPVRTAPQRRRSAPKDSNPKAASVDLGVNPRGGTVPSSLLILLGEAADDEVGEQA